MSNKNTLFGWIKNEICPYGQFEDYVQIVDDSNPPTRTRVRFFSHDYYYGIVCTEDTDYLGAVVSCRKPRAGEDWHRGSDLPDGKFNRATWESIKNAIVRYEFVKIAKNQRGIADK